MDSNNTPYDSNSLELLAQIVDRARFDNRVLTRVSRIDLSSNLTAICQIFDTPINPPKDGKKSPWELIREETPAPTRRYKKFTEALDADDPLAALRTHSRDRSPSEVYLLQVRINSHARSKLTNVEKSLPKLNTANWSELSLAQKKTIFLHIIRLEHYYRRTQSKAPNTEGLLINEAILELACIFTIHTHFDSIPTDLPYTAKSRFIQFTCLALRPVVDPKKLSPGAISKRWRRIKGPSDSQSD